MSVLDVDCSLFFFSLYALFCILHLCRSLSSFLLSAILMSFSFCLTSFFLSLSLFFISSYLFLLFGLFFKLSLYLLILSAFSETGSHVSLGFSVLLLKPTCKSPYHLFFLLGLICGSNVCFLFFLRRSI